MIKTVFGFDNPDDSPGFMLWQTTIIWQRMIKKILDPYEISHAQFVIFAVTFWFESKGQAVTQGLVIRQSKLDKMTVSKSFKILAEKGYIKRIAHKEDTRAKSIFLTKKGKEFISKLIPVIEKVDEDFFATLKKNKRQSFIKTLNQIVVNAESD